MLIGITIGLFILVSVFLILLILIQKGRGGGLASAFGGAGGNTAFGSKTGDVLTWATSIVFGIFLVLAVALNLMAKSSTGDVAGVPNPNTQNTGGVPSSPQVPEGTGLPPAAQPKGSDLIPPTPEQAPSGPTGLSAPVESGTLPPPPIAEPTTPAAPLPPANAPTTQPK
jgi:preprotein translocase subunit SecG